MARSLTASGGVSRRRRRLSIPALWRGLVDGLAALGTVMIAALMVVIAADVVARNGWGGSLPLVSELGALMLVMIVYLQLGTTVRHDRLARTELFSAGFAAARPRLSAAVKALFDLVGFLCCGLIAWATFTIVGRDLRFDEYIGVTGVLTLPTWPFRVLILLGIATAAVQFLVQACAGLLRCLGWMPEPRP